MMDYENPFRDLPADPDLRFVVLEQRERHKYEEAYHNLDSPWSVRAAQFEYMNAVHAFASGLGIEVLSAYPIKLAEAPGFDVAFSTFYAHTRRVGSSFAR